MMRTRFFLLLLGVLSFYKTLAQKDINIPVNHRVILNYDEYVVYADVLTTENRVKPSDNLFYFWFGANDIKRTRGGFDGKLLHGTYSEFYLNKNLREKGSFRYGLKTGEWKSWYINGELKEISSWKNGLQHGKYMTYDEKGNLKERGTYKGGQRTGKVYKYSESGEFYTEKYKRGDLVEKKERKKLKIPFIKKGHKKARPDQKEKQVEAAQDSVTKELKSERAYKEEKEKTGRKRKANAEAGEDPTRQEQVAPAHEQQKRKGPGKKKDVQENPDEIKPAGSENSSGTSDPAPAQDKKSRKKKSE